MPRHAKIRRQHNSEGYFPVTYWLLCGLDPKEATSAPDPEDTPSAPSPPIALETAAPDSASAQAAPGTPEKPSAAKTASTASSPQAPPLESGASADAHPAPQGMPADARPRQARRAKCLKGIPCVAGCMMSERHNAPGSRPPDGKCLKDTSSNTNTAIFKIPIHAAAAPASQKPNRQQSHIDIVGKNKKRHKDKKSLCPDVPKRTSAVASFTRLHVPSRRLLGLNNKILEKGGCFGIFFVSLQKSTETAFI